MDMDVSDDYGDDDDDRNEENCGVRELNFSKNLTCCKRALFEANLNTAFL
jgi:hypothetical protein